MVTEKFWTHIFECESKIYVNFYRHVVFDAGTLIRLKLPKIKKYIHLSIIIYYVMYIF